MDDESNDSQDQQDAVSSDNPDVGNQSAPSDVQDSYDAAQDPSEDPGQAYSSDNFDPAQAEQEGLDSIAAQDAQYAGGISPATEDYGPGAWGYDAGGPDPYAGLSGPEADYGPSAWNPGLQATDAAVGAYGYANGGLNGAPAAPQGYGPGDFAPQTATPHDYGMTGPHSQTVDMSPQELQDAIYSPSHPARRV